MKHIGLLSALHIAQALNGSLASRRNKENILFAISYYLVALCVRWSLEKSKEDKFLNAADEVEWSRLGWATVTWTVVSKT